MLIRNKNISINQIRFNNKNIKYHDWKNVSKKYLEEAIKILNEKNNLPGIAVFAYNRPKHFKKHFIILKNLNSKNDIFYSVMVQKKNDFNVKEVHRIAKA